MTMYLTREPMTKTELDGQLAAIGWLREGSEARDRSDPRAFIHDIDKVPAADGQMHIMIEAKTPGAVYVARALGCVAEVDPEFWTTLGIDLERETRH